MTLGLEGQRPAIIQRALLLEWFTIAWMTVEAIVAVLSGLAAGNLMLIAFGVDSVIELLSAGVLLWRLVVELRSDERFPETVEQRASRIAGGLLWLLVVYVTASAAWSLWQGQGHGQDFSIPGLAVAVVAMPAMYGLAKAKLAVAGQIGSRALRADAVEAITCGYLSAVVVSC